MLDSGPPQGGPDLFFALAIGCNPAAIAAHFEQGASSVRIAESHPKSDHERKVMPSCNLRSECLLERRFAAREGHGHVPGTSR
jgi:hypothetical protein